MSRYQKLFKNLNQNKLGAFIPFITIGDPNPNSFIKIIDALINSGADALELGIPFSDPIADGTSIQNSMKRSFDSGMNVLSCFKLINNIRHKYIELPIGLLVYANLVFKYGIHNFYAKCEELEIDSVLIPDLPIEESTPFYNTATCYKTTHIFICPPNATNKLIHKIIEKSKEYIYLLSRKGITGTKKIEIDNTELSILIQDIKKINKTVPILQGFGIYTPKQAQQSLLLGTNGVIIGSAISNIIDKNHSNTDILLEKIREFTHLIKMSMIL